MNTEKAALVIAFDEIEKSRRRIDTLIDHAVSIELFKQDVNDKPILAKGKSYIKDGHLILVYTDGTKEDVGYIKPPDLILRHTPPPVGTGSGLDAQQVAALIAAALAGLPVSAGSGVESRYEIFDYEQVTVTPGRNMLLAGGLLNNGAVLNNGNIAHVAFA